MKNHDTKSSALLHGLGSGGSRSGAMPFLEEAAAAAAALASSPAERLHSLSHELVDEEKFGDASVRARGKMGKRERCLVSEERHCAAPLHCRPPAHTHRSMHTLSPLLRSGSAYRVETHFAWHDETSLLNVSVTMSSYKWEGR